MTAGATAPPPPPGASGSATMELYRWAEEKVSGVGAPDRVRISDLTDEAKRKFATNPAWVARFVNEALDDMVKSVVRQAVASTRGAYKRYIFDNTIMGVQAYAQQTTKEAATLHMRLMSKWGTWREHVGSGHLRLLDMTRQDLIKAAEERERRAAHELEIATLWREMAKAMPDDNVLVRDTFTVAEIEALSVDIRKAKGTFVNPNITPSDLLDNDDTADDAPDEDEPKA
jgi:hypothetical protein